MLRPRANRLRRERTRAPQPRPPPTACAASPRVRPPLLARESHACAPRDALGRHARMAGWLLRLLLYVVYREEEQVLALAAPTHGARRALQRVVDEIYPRESFKPTVECCTTHTITHMRQMQKALRGSSRLMRWNVPRCTPTHHMDTLITQQAVQQVQKIVCARRPPSVVPSETSGIQPGRCRCTKMNPAQMMKHASCSSVRP